MPLLNQGDYVRIPNDLQQTSQLAATEGHMIMNKDTQKIKLVPSQNVANEQDKNCNIDYDIAEVGAKDDLAPGITYKRFYGLVSKLLKAQIKTSDLDNDEGFITDTVDSLLNYYLKSETYTKQQVLDLISAITQVSIQKVDVLPATGEPNIIYLVLSSSGSAQNIYEQWIYSNTEWVMIGTTQVDLSQYLLKSEFEDWKFDLNDNW